MRQRDPERSHDELKRLLRDGDPAGDGSEPSPAEIARLRRTVVETSRESRPAWLAVPALAAATILALAVAAWMLPRPGGAPGSAGPVDPVVDPRPVETEAVTEAGSDDPAEIVVASTLPDDAATVAQGPPPPSLPLPTPPPGATPVSEGNASAEAASSRTVRFTTPNGTRIVWVLNPNLDI
jgi:hypothetical protein